MAISEKVELLGKGCYTDIPDVLTVKSIPTASELDYVSAEDFNKTMIEKILPKAVEEKVDFSKLLEPDYYWLLRCLRIINYGPYFTTNAIYCENCGREFGEYRCNLNAVECKPFPQGFKNNLKIPREEFIDFNGDVTFQILTVREMMMCEKDESFKDPQTGRTNRELARLCYSIRTMGTDHAMNPVEVRLKLEKDITSADYIIIKEMSDELRDYGLRAGGRTTCPKCGNTNATFIAMIDDRYFRPTLGDLRSWKTDKNRERVEKSIRSKTKNV